MIENKIIELAENEGLKRLKGKLKDLIKESISLITTSANEGDIRIGSTKIGGMPDMPVDLVWPEHKGKPISLLAQINLEEIKNYDKDNVLPNTGMLYFFYDNSEQNWGYDPADKETFKIIHYDSELSVLKRIEFPDSLDKDCRFNPCSVEFKNYFTLPEYDSYAIEALGLTNEEADLYIELLENSYDDDDDVIHSLLGYPVQIQGDMMLECQLVSNGLYCGDEVGYDDPKAEELKDGSRNWRLLLQIDTDDNADMMWGDSGMIYFWIEEENLKKKQFDKSWCILQCY